MGVAVNFPTSATVGQTGLPATFTVFNTSTAPDELGTVTVGQMTLIPSCSNFDPGCDGPGSTPDPGVFNLSATGVGEADTACPTLSTVASPSVALGGQITDTANTGRRREPNRHDHFQPVGPGNTTCTGAAIFAPSETVAGNGPYTSDPFTPLAAGTYQWVAFYGGDAGNNSVATACNDPVETVVVTAGPGPVTPTLTTDASPNISLGGQVTDTSTLAGGDNPTGTITFNLYGPDDPTCAGAAAFNDPKTVAGNGSYTSNAFSPVATGAYQWVATYSGDANNAAVTTACSDPAEYVTVITGPVLVTPTITTQVEPATASVGQGVVDIAMLAGGGAPTGTITFNAYGPADTTCTTAPVYTANVPVNGNGAYPATPAFVAAAPGHYRFIASYSGDAFNDAVSGACNDPNEVHVATVSPLPTITVDKTATPGSLPAPAGLFTFSVSVTNSSTVALVITSINDSVYGNLGTRLGVNTCDDLIGDTLAPAGSTSCSFQGSFTGAAGAAETDVVTVVATDASGNQATAQESATVSLTAPVPPDVPRAYPAHAGRTGRTREVPGHHH